MEKVIVGVGFLMFTLERIPRLFVVKELKGKPAILKERGMRSFPLETMKEIDGGVVENTIRRLIREEIGTDQTLVEILGVEQRRFKLIHGRDDVVTVYGYGLFLGNPEQKFSPLDTDIVFAGWKTLAELSCSFTRVETVPILNHFQENHFQEVVQTVT
jgi:hypothetical protein